MQQIKLWKHSATILESSKTWYGKTQVTSYELRVESLKARVEIQKCEFETTIYGCEYTSYEFKSTSYEFKPLVKSSNSRIIKSVKTPANSFKSSSFPKIFSEVTQKLSFCW